MFIGSTVKLLLMCRLFIFLNCADKVSMMIVSSNCVPLLKQQISFEKWLLKFSNRVSTTDFGGPM